MVAACLSLERLVKDTADDLLDTTIGILFEAAFFILHVTDRRRRDILAAPMCFGALPRVPGCPAKPGTDREPARARASVRESDGF